MQYEFREKIECTVFRSEAKLTAGIAWYCTHLSESMPQHYSLETNALFKAPTVLSLSWFLFSLLVSFLSPFL